MLFKNPKSQEPTDISGAGPQIAFFFFKGLRPSFTRWFIRFLSSRVPVPCVCLLPAERAFRVVAIRPFGRGLLVLSQWPVSTGPSPSRACGVVAGARALRRVRNAGSRSCPAGSPVCAWSSGVPLCRHHRDGAPLPCRA